MTYESYNKKSIDEIFDGIDTDIEYVTITTVDGETVTLPKYEVEQIIDVFGEIY